MNIVYRLRGTIMYISEKDMDKYQGMGERNKKGKTLKEFLEEYNPNKYPNPSVTVDMAIFAVESLDSFDADSMRKFMSDVRFGKDTDKELKILLIKRGDHPYMGWWATPGGFVGYKEEIEAAAYRELKEETGCSDALLTEVCVCGDVYRDPRTRVISTLYTGILDSGEIEYEAGDDAADALLFTVKVRECSGTEKKENNGETEKIYKRYLLSLENEENGIKLSAGVGSTTQRDRFFEKTEYKVEEKNGISADHGALIMYALDRFTRL